MSKERRKDGMERMRGKEKEGDDTHMNRKGRKKQQKEVKEKEENYRKLWQERIIDRQEN